MSESMISNSGIKHRGRSGFTLFEIAISLAILTFGVISVLMLMPAGIKAQNMARYRILAAAKAMGMIEAYVAGNYDTASEAWEPWDIPINSKNMHPDLESRICTPKYGIFPLPMDIAKRLTSDGDEIQRVLALGGYLYYSQPLATAGMNEKSLSLQAQPEEPNEAQRLIIGIVGYPQNNTLAALPQKAWPYQAAYPSPPVHFHQGKGLKTDTAHFPVKSRGAGAMLWEDVNLGGKAGDALREVGDLYCKLWYFIDEKDPNFDNVEYQSKLREYADSVVNWCKTYAPAGADICWNGDAEIPMTNGTFKFPIAQDKHIQVLAARLMAHVGLMLRAVADDAGSSDPTISGITFSEQAVAHMHSNCLALGFTFAASYPYDWGAPRPLQRSIMMDYPLIEYDLMVDYLNPKPIASDPQVPVSSDLYKGPIYGEGTIAYKWRPTTPRRVVNAGVNARYPAVAGNGDTSDDVYWRNVWSSPHNSTITARFKSAERCRQIVFWAVDWQSYEDFETAPSAPVDAGKFPKQPPSQGKTFDQLCTDGQWKYWQQLPYRNPEVVLTFVSDMSNYPTGTPTPMCGGRDNSTELDVTFFDPGTHGPDARRKAAALDQGLTGIKFERFKGAFGADRNANQKLDRGPVPKSVRLHASTVARFNYYDMRVPAMLR